MLYLVGLGLGDPSDVTVKGLEVIRKAEKVILEAYTSILVARNQHEGQCTPEAAKETLEKFYGREITLADREFVEQKAEDEILSLAKDKDVAFLVVGDPFGATTHMDLVIRARELNISTKSIHNASIMNAIGCVGLQLYNYGETVSIPFWSEGWEPDSFYDKIIANYERGLHTLCLLDIKVKEQTVENMMKGKAIFEPPRFMSTKQAAEQLLAISEKRIKEKKEALVGHNSMAIGVARVGSDSQKLVSCSLEELKYVDLGSPLHSLIIPGQMHPIELDAYKMHALPFY